MTTPTDELRRLQQKIDRCDPESLIELLLARNAQHRARLVAACESLRAAAEDRASAHRRLAALVAHVADASA